MDLACEKQMHGPGNHSMFVRYDEPIAVREKKNTSNLLVQSKTGSSVNLHVDDRVTEEDGVKSIGDVTSMKSQETVAFQKRTMDCKGIAAQLDQLTREQQVRQALNEIFPPRVTTNQDSSLSVQQVSCVSSTPEDIEQLKLRLEKELKDKQIRFSGVCPKRRQVFDHLWDELIRQETTVIAERGLLLSRVKNEFNLVVDSYHELHKSATSYSSRKNIICPHLFSEAEKRLNKLQAEREELLATLVNAKSAFDIQEKKEMERIALEDKKHADEIIYWKRNNQILENILKGLQIMSYLQRQTDNFWTILQTTLSFIKATEPNF